MTSIWQLKTFTAFQPNMQSWPNNSCQSQFVLRSQNSLNLLRVFIFNRSFAQTCSYTGLMPQGTLQSWAMHPRLNVSQNLPILTKFPLILLLWKSFWFSLLGMSSGNCSLDIARGKALTATNNTQEKTNPSECILVLPSRVCATKSKRIRKVSIEEKC